MVQTRSVVENNSMKERELQRAISENIREARMQLGFSQAELAEKADISASFMNDVERSRRSASINALCRIAAALKIEPYILLKTDKVEKEFDRNSELVSFSRKMKEEFRIKMDEVLDSALNYGSSQSDDDPVKEP